MCMNICVYSNARAALQRPLMMPLRSTCFPKFSGPSLGSRRTKACAATVCTRTSLRTSNTCLQTCAKNHHQVQESGPWRSLVWGECWTPRPRMLGRLTREHKPSRARPASSSRNYEAEQIIGETGFAQLVLPVWPYLYVHINVPVVLALC